MYCIQRACTVVECIVQREREYVSRYLKSEWGWGFPLSYDIMQSSFKYSEIGWGLQTHTVAMAIYGQDTVINLASRWSLWIWKYAELKSLKMWLNIWFDVTVNERRLVCVQFSKTGSESGLLSLLLLSLLLLPKFGSKIVSFQSLQSMRMRRNSVRY